MKQADQQTRLGRGQVVSGWLENAYNSLNTTKNGLEKRMGERDQQ
jgi:hypothetical protein